MEAKELEAIQAELKKIGDSVKEEGQKALAEAEKHGKVSAEAKTLVDGLMTKQGELTQRITALEQKSVRAPGGDDLTIGSVLEKHAPQLKEFATKRQRGASITVPFERKVLLGSSASGLALTYPGQQVLPMPAMPLLRRLTIRDLMMPGKTDSAVIFYQRETGYTNNAAVVAQGNTKPTSEITFENVTQAVVTIAHLQNVSTQMLADVPYIASYIEGRMRYALALVEEAELLNGTGVGDNLEGLYTVATPYLQPSGAVVDDETLIDRLRLAMLQAELANATTTGIVLHPTDWANIELTKDTQGRYIFTNPTNTTTGRLWGRDVVSTTAMTQDTFLVGDFMMHSQIFDREEASVAISFEHADNFAKNLATIRVEERLASAIYRPEAFIKGNLTGT